MQDCAAMRHILLSPMTWGLLWLVVTWLAWARVGRWWRTLLVLAGLAILLLCTPLGANALVRLVESRTPSAMQCSAEGEGWRGAPIVVLAGGLRNEPRTVDDYIALTPSSWHRLRGGVELWRQDATAPMVIAGGGPFQTKEATVLTRLAQDWGVPAAQLRAETQSTNTWESAMALRGTLPARVRLVTSAMHLPRALLAFGAAGFEPCGRASDSDYVGPGSIGYVMPQLSAMQKTQLALYEMAGMASYRLRAH